MADQDTLNKSPTQEADGLEQTRGQYYRPNVDILEKDDELVVLADMPGAKGDQIDVHFEDGTLAIHAKVEPRQDPKVQYLINEYGVGDYYRNFKVSEAIDPEKITAEFANGVLTLHLPKAETLKPRKISVKS